MYQPFTSSLAPLAKHGFNWGSLLTNTQKTLNIINQAIPVYYQVKPMWNNAKTMFRIIGEMGKINSTSSSSNTKETTTSTDANKNNERVSTSGGPNFFI
jgi:hypothetical protein